MQPRCVCERHLHGMKVNYHTAFNATREEHVAELVHFNQRVVQKQVRMHTYGSVRGLECGPGVRYQRRPRVPVIER